MSSRRPFLREPASYFFTLAADRARVDWDSGLESYTRRLPFVSGRSEAAQETSWLGWILELLRSVYLVDWFLKQLIEVDEDGLRISLSSDDQAPSDPSPSGSDKTRGLVGSPLGQLPCELLAEVMAMLPGPSIWSLRQTSSCFMEIFNGHDFRHLHGKTLDSDVHATFDTDSFDSMNKFICRKLLERDQHCSACKLVLERGESDRRLMRLRGLRYCHGCQEKHAGIFFSAEDLDKYDAGKKIQCVGRRGKLRLCSHTEDAAALTWGAIERQTPTLDSSLTRACSSPSHRASQRQWFADSHGSAQPLLYLCRDSYTGDNIEISLGWDLPVLEIDQRRPPSVAAIRDTLSNLLPGSVSEYKHKLCKHMRDGLHLRGFAQTGICECFAQPGATRYPDPFNWEENMQPCRCDRQRYLDCKYCGASYAWILIAGCVTLSYRYIWRQICRPTTPAWLALLDDVPQSCGVFTAANKHLLWCDEPRCATGKGPRWEALVKEELWLHDVRYGQALCNYHPKERDYRQLMHRAQDHQGGYWMPPHTHLWKTLLPDAQQRIKAIERGLTAEEEALESWTMHFPARLLRRTVHENL